MESGLDKIEKDEFNNLDSGFISCEEGDVRDLSDDSCIYSDNIECPYSEKDCPNCTIKQRINRKRK